MKYKKTLGTILAKNEGKFYIIRGRELFNVNEVGARIFELCNGIDTSDDMVDKLSKFYETDKSKVNSEINSFLFDLVDLELIKESK